MVQIEINDMDVKVNDPFDRFTIFLQKIVRHPSKDNVFEVFSVEQAGK